MTTEEPTYRSIPALAAYIGRIGAEELNFRRFMVRQYFGRSAYYTEQCIIKINSDGSIYCSQKEYEPTQQEAREIKEAILAANFPLTINARDSSVLRNQLGHDANIYEFWDRSTNELAMVQQRVNFPNGTKAYLPWTFFSDGKWRRMEPDGELPFWKPKSSRNLPRIMVHEGAKVAHFIDDLVNNPERRDEFHAHPWCDTLVRYEHWGMIGGALAPHRARYAELTRESPQEVIYVCDNDFEGKSVLQIFSRHYQKSLKGIIFDDNFPEKWDMADAIPKSLFRKNNYNGPNLERMMWPATWSTKRVPNASGRGPGIIVLTDEFRKEWLHSISPEAFVHINWPNRILTAAEFNDAVAPFSDAASPADLFKKDQVSKKHQLSYTPAHTKGVYHDQRGSFINTHVASDIRIINGDPQPWLNFMEHLCPDPNDLKELMRWCATLIAKPEIRMHYGILAISETQGVGKGTLGEKILAPLVGMGNVSFPPESEIVDSNYNYWISHKRLAIVHEIYAGHSSRAYNKLKSAITDQRITVTRKYMANYEVENWIHIFACSNSLRALKLSVDDRRWFVPRIVEARKPTNYWQEFNTWLEMEGGLGIIKHWAQQYLQTNEPVRTGDAAPNSSLKRDVIEEGLSSGQELVLRTLNHTKEQLKAIANGNNVTLKEDWERRKFLHNGNVIVLDKTLIELIKQEIYQGRPSEYLERPQTVRHIAKLAGWTPSPRRAKIKQLGHRYFQAYTICSSGELAALDPVVVFDQMNLMPLPLELLRDPM